MIIGKTLIHNTFAPSLGNMGWVGGVGWVGNL